MRDTFIGLIIMFTVAGIYMGSKHSQSEVSAQVASLQTQSSTISKKTKKHSLEKKFIKIAKGDKHESTNHRSREQVQLHGADSRTSKSVKQNEKLASIYQDEAPQTASAVATAEVDSTLGEMGNTGDSAPSDSIESASTPTAILASNQTTPKSVLGVPISSWIRTQKNRLAARPSQAESNGMRFIFNCTEIKNKGPQALNERDCEALAAKTELPLRNTY